MKKSEIIIKISPYRQDKVTTIRQKISSTEFTAEDLTSVIDPFLKENITYVKIVSKKEKNSEEEFSLEAGAFNGCWNLSEVVLDVDNLVLSHNAFDGCGGIRRIKYPRGW